jgi:hypothetical protein
MILKVASTLAYCNNTAGYMFVLLAHTLQDKYNLGKPQIYNPEQSSLLHSHQGKEEHPLYKQYPRMLVGLHNRTHPFLQQLFAHSYRNLVKVERVAGKYHN